MYTDEQLGTGLKNQFIQIHLKTLNDFNRLERICKSLNCNMPITPKNGAQYIFGQIFNDNSFGLNGSYSPKENLTIITL